MHSSRMSTARMLTVSHRTEEGGLSVQGRSLLRGDACPGWCLHREDQSAQGVFCPGVSAQGVGVCQGCVSAQGVCAWEVYPNMKWGRHPTPMNRITDRCKNITLPQTSFAGGNKWHSSYWYSINGHEVSNLCLAPKSGYQFEYNTCFILGRSISTLLYLICDSLV